MEITNYDTAIKDTDTAKHHYLIPNCHFMIVGSTGQGKTNLLLNILLKWMDYTKCFVYTINPDQDKYSFLAEQEGIEILNPEEITPVEDLDHETQKVIVFDDIKLDNRSMNNIKEYFSLSRNKNCNCIYLTQSYYDVPKYIRRNTNCFALFGNLDNKDVRHICDDHAKGLPRKQLELMYKDATDEPYSFMVLDKTSKVGPLMYRKGFNKFWHKHKLKLSLSLS